jgi:hypothetical protein
MANAKQDIAKRFFAAAKGVTPEAAQFDKRVQLVSHFPGLLKAIAKLSIPKSLTGPAQIALDGYEADGLHDFRLVYGLVSLLVMDGSKKSIAIVTAFADRADRRTQDDTVIDGAQLVLRTLKAFGKSADAKSLTKKLEMRVSERHASSEAAALLTRIAPKIAAAPKARVSIWIGVEGQPPDPWFGMMQNGPRIHMSISIHDKPDWKLDVHAEPKGLYGHEGGQYSNWGGNVSQDDFGLPKLASLEQFPAWIPLAAKKLRAKFSVAAALVDAGRQKASIPPVRTWLENKAV